MNESDKTLEAEVRKKLLSNGEVDTHNFDIEVEEGVVKLEGDVSGRHAKKVVDECLSEMEGVRHLENKLKIRRISRFSDNSTHGF